MKLYKEKLKLEFNNKTSTRMNKEDVDLLHLLNTCGIYIYISPSKKAAYVGQSYNIFRRLKEHLRDTFIDFEYSTCTSRFVLREDDVEMYCCFLESRNQYDYSNVNDLDKELRILESFIMDVMKDNRYYLVNKGQGDYDISDLESNSIYKYKNTINLGDNIFKFGLDSILKFQLFNNTSAIDSKIKKLSNQVNKYKLEMNKLNNQINNLYNAYNLEISKLSNGLSLKTKELDNYKSILNQAYNSYKDFIFNSCENLPYDEHNPFYTPFINVIINSSSIKSKNSDLKSKIGNILNENIDITNILNKDILLEIIKLSSSKTRANVLLDLSKSGHEKLNIMKQYLDIEYNYLSKIYNIISN